MEKVVIKMYLRFYNLFSILTGKVKWYNAIKCLHRCMEYQFILKNIVTSKQIIIKKDTLLNHKMTLKNTDFCFTYVTLYGQNLAKIIAFLQIKKNSCFLLLTLKKPFGKKDKMVLLNSRTLTYVLENVDILEL